MTSEYETNPNKRCMYCKGREVIEIKGNSRKSNLMQINGRWFCTNKKECQQNIEAEGTIVDFYFDEKTNTITGYTIQGRYQDEFLEVLTK